jgi:O-Glycosyl hydrolase family 30.
MDIHSALFYGNISAWVWWQGSQADVLGEFNLMKGTTVGKRYYASKHFYRYIRPGAVRVKSVSDSEELFVTAFENSKKTSHTIVIINTSSDKSLTISGSDLPVTLKCSEPMLQTKTVSLSQKLKSIVHL